MKPSVLLQHLDHICDHAKEYWEQLGLDGEVDEDMVKDELSEIEAIRDFLTLRLRHAIQVDDNIMILIKPRGKKGGSMNPLKKFLCLKITDLTEDLSCSKAERGFLGGFNAGRKSWKYAALSLHIEWIELQIELLKALGGV